MKVYTAVVNCISRISLLDMTVFVLEKCALFLLLILFSDVLFWFVPKRVRHLFFFVENTSFHSSLVQVMLYF